MQFDIAAARSRLARREMERRAKLQVRFDDARRDFDAIVEMLIKKYAPYRIYQWGSLLNEAMFWEHSDIDIGVQGIRNAEEHAAMQADAEALTESPVDLVNMDRIDPWFAETIKNNGRLVYERGKQGE
jgi:predicted nucleotidyltransferase